MWPAQPFARLLWGLWTLVVVLGFAVVLLKL